MKALFFPIGDINRASSRYRAHNIVPACKEFEMGGKRNWQNGDVLIFQRALLPRHFDFAKQGRAAGKLIIFDITDFYFYRYKWQRQMKAIKKMANLAHCITTGNKDDAWLIKSTLGKRVYVIPNAQKPSKHRRKHQNVRIPTVVWLGRENTMDKTLGTVWGTLQRLSREGVPFKVLLINDTGNTHGLILGGGWSATHGHFIANKVVGVKWSLDKVYPTVAKCDLGICPQVKQSNGRYHKDENKAYTCWVCGIPCVSFARTKSWYDDLKRLLTDWKLRERQGRRTIARAKEVAPAQVARVWMKVIKRELAKLK